MRTTYRLTWYQGDKTSGSETHYNEESAMRKAEYIIRSGVTRKVTIIKAERIAIVRIAEPEELVIGTEES